MVKPELLDWIKKSLANGHTETQVYDFLVKQGYMTHEAIEAIDCVNKTTKVAQKKARPIDKFLPVIIVGIIFIVVGGGAVYYLVGDKITIPILPQKPPNVEKPVNVSDDDDDDDDDGKNVTQLPQTTVCTAYDCFDNRFALCQKARWRDISLEGVTTDYEIIRAKGVYCEVKIKSIANPNPNWVQKEMTCGLNNSLYFNDAVKDISRCSGSLLDAMVGQHTQINGSCNMPCPNCVRGSQKPVRGTDICVDCTVDSDCNDGFECFSDNTCISMAIIRDCPLCVAGSCEAYTCEHCMSGYRFCHRSTAEYKNNRCVECSSDEHCIESYVCTEYECVPWDKNIARITANDLKLLNITVQSHE